MYTEQLHHKIEAYLAGKLDPDERAAFEQQIREDQEVKDYVEAHKTADAALSHSIEQDLRNKLANLDIGLDQLRSQESTEKKGSTLYPSWRLAAVAASLLIALALVMHFWTRSNTAPEKLAEQNLVILDGQTRGGQIEESPFQLMDRAASAFSEKKYDEAAGLYRAVMNGDNLLYESAEFNLALVLLAKGEIRNARARLEAIAGNSDHQYQQASAEIISKLEN